MFGQISIIMFYNKSWKWLWMCRLTLCYISLLTCWITFSSTCTTCITSIFLSQLPLNFLCRINIILKNFRRFTYGSASTSIYTLPKETFTTSSFLWRSISCTTRTPHAHPPPPSLPPTRTPKSRFSTHDIYIYFILFPNEGICAEEGRRGVVKVVIVRLLFQRLLPASC